MHLARLLAVKLVENELTKRANEKTEWPACAECGGRLESKGRLPRQLDTLIGTIKWRRSCGRCKNKCRIGQIAPLDEKLGIQPNQKSCQSLKKAACVLAVFISYESAAVLLTMLTGITVSPRSIWNWVQVAGELAVREIEQKLEALSKGNLPEYSLEGFEKTLMAIGADGVMVPFRPNGGSPEGKTVWREVKIGIMAWLQKKSK